MNDDFEIEIQQDTQEQSNQVQLPMNILLFGEVENDDVKVYIKQDVYKALEKYALADIEHERGTIILGDYYEELGKKHVIVSNYIEAKYTDASASTLTFTHETWDYVHKEHDEKFSDKKIVGWQHTHPSYGIFLSNYDLFIHENFFNLPFQIAYVIDPVQNIRGFFQWKNGKIEKLKGYYIYDDIGKPIKIEQVQKEKEKKQLERSNSTKILTLLVSLLCVATVILAISTISLKRLYNRQLEEQIKMQASVQEQESTIKSQTDTIEELQTKINENSASTDGIKYIMYTVQSGDTLLKICEDKNVDFYSNKKIILSMNGIDNPDEIHVGQNIILPIINKDS